MEISPDNLAPMIAKRMTTTNFFKISPTQEKCAYNRTRFLQGCSYILRGSLAEIQTFGSRGTIISPIRILMYDFGAPMQTIDIIRQVTLVRELFRKIG